MTFVTSFKGRTSVDLKQTGVCSREVYSNEEDVAWRCMFNNKSDSFHLSFDLFQLHTQLIYICKCSKSNNSNLAMHANQIDWPKHLQVLKNWLSRLLIFLATFNQFSCLPEVCTRIMSRALLCPLTCVQNASAFFVFWNFLWLRISSKRDQVSC